MYKSNKCIKLSEPKHYSGSAEAHHGSIGVGSVSDGKFESGAFSIGHGGSSHGYGTGGSGGHQATDKTYTGKAKATHGSIAVGTISGGRFARSFITSGIRGSVRTGDSGIPHSE
ncbi:unnamed protein product [Chrysodeixis includens]|uniref:Uncharacterized protein n=1 Tax=Chrysodeixis includens TaxID=689277 RepID=A0A9N8KYI9_CHRIL|nr:unnamed protein product [Chrysodeixis includens]